MDTPPPQDSTSRFTIASPSPVPVERVEKCGSKTRGMRAAGGARRTQARERAGDRREAIDLPEDRARVAREDVAEVGTPVLPRAPHVLDRELDRRQRILDFVRHLTRHLAPGEHALGAQLV